MNLRSHFEEKAYLLDLFRGTIGANGIWVRHCMDGAGPFFRAGVSS
jgi:hypothetical protein